MTAGSTGFFGLKIGFFLRQADVPQVFEPKWSGGVLLDSHPRRKSFAIFPACLELPDRQTILNSPCTSGPGTFRGG